MAPRSKVHTLPPELKEWLDRELVARGFGDYVQLAADLKERGAQAHAGDLPSRSAIGRYGQKLERRLSAIRASTEAAKLIQAQAGDDKDARSEALTALVQTELFEAILALQDADDPDLDPGKRVDMLSSAAKNIATLTRSSVNLKQFQAKVEKDTRDRLLAEQRAALDAMGSKGGVTEDTKRAIREALGIM